MKNRIMVLLVGILLLLFSSLSSQTIVTLTSPNGGEVFEWDSTHTITWTFSPPPNWIYDCYLYLSTDGGATFPDTISASGIGDTFFVWTIPHVVSSTCRVLIQVDSMGVSIGCEDVSDSNFSIVQPGIKESDESLQTSPSRICISPNPFITVTNIQLSGIQKDTKHDLSIYDVSGCRVGQMSLVTFKLPVAVTWDGRDDDGKVLHPGIYFLKFNGRPVGKVVKVR